VNLIGLAVKYARGKAVQLRVTTLQEIEDARDDGMIVVQMILYDSNIILGVMEEWLFCGTGGSTEGRLISRTLPNISSTTSNSTLPRTSPSPQTILRFFLADIDQIDEIGDGLVTSVSDTAHDVLAGVESTLAMKSTLTLAEQLGGLLDIHNYVCKLITYNYLTCDRNVGHVRSPCRSLPYLKHR